MTVEELKYGAYKSKNDQENLSLLDNFLMTVVILGADMEIMQKFGQLKARLTTKGISLADADILIASTALSRCKFLVTGNRRHFSKIENLIIQDWAGKGAELSKKPGFRSI